MNEPIRILHVIGAMNRGGAETMIMNIYRQIDRSKIQFDFVVHTDQISDYDNEILSLGGRIFRTKKYVVKNFFSYKRWWEEFFCKHSDYKIIHGHINSSAAIYLHIAKKHGLYTFVHSHATKTNDPGFRKYVFYASSYPIRFIADFFLGCSKQAGIDRFGKKIAFNNKRFTVIKNGINISKFKFDDVVRKEVREALDSEKRIVIGHVGRFAVVKNHDFIVDVFYEFHQIVPNSKLWLIGEGELKTAISEKVKALGIENDVCFIGGTDKVERYLMGMDVFIFPSKYEGLGISLIEAEASGLTCIASEAIQNEAIVSDRAYRLPIDANINKWVNTIISIFNKNDHYERQLYAKKVEDAGYSIKESASKLLMLYYNAYDKQKN